MPAKRSTSQRSTPKQSSTPKSGGKRSSTKTAGQRSSTKTDGKRSSSKSSPQHSSPKGGTKHSSSKKWSASVTKHSNALDLEKNIFKSKNPNQIARSLEDSAEKSTRKKGTPYQSAMSMLNFYINRAGKNLPAKQRSILVEAKDKLKALHEKDQQKQTPTPKASSRKQTPTRKSSPRPKVRLPKT